jgi:hypothetical protein
VHQVDSQRSVRIIAPNVFTAMTRKENQIRPYRTRRAFTLAGDATTRSYITVCKSTHAIRVPLNKIFTAVARAICMRPESSREMKPKSYSRPRDLSRYIVLGTTSPGDMIAKNGCIVYRNMPPFRPVQTEQNTGRSEEQMQRTMEEKHKLCGGENI